MIEDVYNLSGRHLTEEEIGYVVKKRCEDLGVTVLEIKNPKKIAKTDVKIKCSNCGVECFRTSLSIIKYKTTECKQCSNSRKQGQFKRRTLTKETLQEIINEKYKDKEIYFSVVDDFTYENNKQIVKVKCSHCDNICESRIDLLKQGRKSCECQQIRSKLELKVKRILEKHNVEFKKECGFEDLRYIQPLRYDFAVSVNNKIYLIECDGVQHFYPTFGKVSFERTLTTDEIKNNYAKTNNIPLLRIPYNTKECIESVIIEFINS